MGLPLNDAPHAMQETDANALEGGTAAAKRNTQNIAKNAEKIFTLTGGSKKRAAQLVGLS